MGDPWPEAEAKMRQSLGLSAGSRSPVADDPQRLARQAIRSQAAARDYAERQLVRAEQTIQDLQTKFHAVRREKALAIEAAKAAQAAQVQAERGRRAAEAALINEKSVSAGAQQDAREARAMVHDLRTKLALVKSRVETLEAQLAEERQARITAEQAPTPAPAAVVVNETAEVPVVQSVERKRGRPPDKRDAPVPRQGARKTRKIYADNQEPVRWWAEGWKPAT